MVSEKGQTVLTEGRWMMEQQLIIGVARPVIIPCVCGRGRAALAPSRENPHLFQNGHWCSCWPHFDTHGAAVAAQKRAMSEIEQRFTAIGIVPLWLDV